LAETSGIMPRSGQAIASSGSDVDSDVEDHAARHTHQLALRMRRLLPVQAAQHAARRARMVVLDEGDPLAGRGHERLLVVALEEEAARVAEHLGLDDEHAFDRGGSGLHPCLISRIVRDRAAQGLRRASLRDPVPTIRPCSTP
jgi:hypothetical protein